MATINELVARLSEIAANPAAELDRYIAAGKKVIGVGPYYVPEELVYAAGGVPFGVWGRMGTATEARRCSPQPCSGWRSTLLRRPARLQSPAPTLSTTRIAGGTARQTFPSAYSAAPSPPRV